MRDLFEEIILLVCGLIDQSEDFLSLVTELCNSANTPAAPDLPKEFMVVHDTETLMEPLL